MTMSGTSDVRTTRSKLPVPAANPRQPPPAAEAAVDAPRSAAGELDQLRAERDEYLRALQRLKAEFSNYRKRMIRQQTQVVAEATEDLVRRLLPVLDALELGAQHVPDQLRPVLRQLQDTLAEEGLQRFEPIGADFDPTEQQAVADDPVVPLRPGSSRETVSSVLRPGYRLRGRLLRPALVRIRSRPRT
jgi:molecular chaperone GrpE